MIPPLFHGLCDDAALFPPGNAPLTAALPQHRSYRTSAFAELVGPFIFPIPRLDELTSQTVPLDISLTAPGGPATVAPALKAVDGLANVRVVAVEVAIPEDAQLDDLHDIVHDIDIYIEVPRGPRRTEVLNIVDDRGYLAKFRTGGVTAQAYPDEAELADAIFAATSRDIPFKATAGLHHAVRNTVAATGFEQHGYLNVLLAAQAARGGAQPAELETLLRLRDAHAVAERVAAIDTERAFISFGTCSILEPLEDLISLGLIPSDLGAPLS